jgi:uncharacterized protein
MITATTIAFLTGLAFIAGIFDAIAGGSGLIILPALLLAGLDPLSAIATNKLQGSFGTGSAAIQFASHGDFDLKKCRMIVLVTFAASCAGALLVRYAPLALLQAAMPILLILVAIYFAFSPRISDLATEPRISFQRFTWTAAPAIGFYDAIFGPGAGSFYLLGFMGLLGYAVLRAAAYTKLLNFTSNIAALLVFALAGKVYWIMGLSMGVGQFLGARVGSRLAIRNGAKLIRPLVVVVCCGMAIRLLMDPANPLRQMF